MTEPTATYTAVTKRGNCITYELTPAEVSIIEWIRSHSNNNWAGTINYWSDTNIFQMADHRKAGQVRGRS